MHTHTQTWSLEPRPIPELDRPNQPPHTLTGKTLSQYQQSHSAVLQTVYTTTHTHTHTLFISCVTEITLKTHVQSSLYLHQTPSVEHRHPWVPRAGGDCSRSQRQTWNQINKTLTHKQNRIVPSHHSSIILHHYIISHAKTNNVTYLLGQQEVEKILFIISRVSCMFHNLCVYIHNQIVPL